MSKRIARFLDGVDEAQLQIHDSAEWEAQFDISMVKIRLS